MENLKLPQWTLTARIDGRAVEYSLGDGYRLSWHARRPAKLLQFNTRPATAAGLFGVELAGRLQSSAPRPLNILYNGETELDGVDWEQLGLGPTRMAEHFALSRQFISDFAVDPPSARTLAETLDVCVLHSGMAHSHVPAQKIAFNALGQPWARDAVARAHVITLDGVRLGQLLEQTAWPRQQRLIVLAGFESTHEIADALDAGAAVLCMAHSSDFIGETAESLMQQLGNGLSVGDAVRWLHRGSKQPGFEARLYGEPEMRFVRPQEPASRRQVTSLSFDLVGSTRMIAQLGDESYAEMMAGLHARCAEIMRRYGGQPDDPQGDDGVMCYFGHPVAVEDAAAHAVEAGLAIVSASAELGVTVRVGIATGLLAIMAGQPWGVPVHLAARLQQSAAPGTVRVSESTRRLVCHAFDLTLIKDRPLLRGIDRAPPKDDDRKVRRGIARKLRTGIRRKPLKSLGRPPPRGVESQVAAYLVTGLRRNLRESRLERLPALTPLVGRQAELDRLHRHWHETRMGETRFVSVSAEAGMGKSRLVREFRHQLAKTGARVLECRCRADASASPFLTLAEALRRWMDIAPDDSSDQSLHKLAVAVPGHDPEGESFALLAAFLGLRPQPSQYAPGSARQRLLGLLVDWFQAFAGGQPCCLIVDDWHWVDPSMREFVERLVDRRDGPGLLVVTTVRITKTSEATPQPQFASPSDHIELSGLRPEAARELVHLVCGDRPLPARLVMLLGERGDGVPLFLEEASLRALELGADRAEQDLRARKLVPEKLKDLLTARIDATGDAKWVAQVAAVLGRQFSRTLLAALLLSAGHLPDAAALDERLSVLVGSGLVRSEGDGRFAFRHALIRDAAYGLLLKRDRRALHERVVKLLRERWPELAWRQPELLALHQEEAGLNTEALSQWELAARQAAARSAELEAISHLRQALALLPKEREGVERDRTALRLQLQLAARLMATEGYGADAVLEAYLEAQRLCDRIGDDTERFKVEMGLGAYRFMRAHFAPAHDHGRRAAAIARGSSGVKQRLQAHWSLACTLFHQGDLRATMREMSLVLALYRPEMHPQFGIQDPGLMCKAYSSWGLWELGQPDEALERINEAVALAAEFEHRFSQAVTLAYGVSVQLLRGEFDAALARAQLCERVCEEANYPVWLAITRCMRGYLLCQKGEFATGLREINEGYAQWLATGAVVSQPLYLSLQAEGLLLAGDLQEASGRVDEGLAIIERYGERQLQAELTRLRGEIAMRQGDLADGEAWLTRAYVLALRRHRLGFALRSATSLARHWAATGRRDRARRLLEPLAERWKEGRSTRDLRAAAAVIETLN